jgi:hypothetical protein
MGTLWYCSDSFLSLNNASRKPNKNERMHTFGHGMRRRLEEKSTAPKGGYSKRIIDS